MNRLGQDFRHALRSLLRTPSFTAVAVLTLGLGIGANTAIFQLIDAVALRKLPVRDPDGLAAVRIVGGNRGFGVNPGRYPELTSPVWEDLQKQQQGFSEMFAWKTRDLRVGERNDLKRAYGIAVSGDFFNVLGIRPFRGRLLGRSDAGACPETAAVVSHAYWQREMGGRDVGNGTTIRINLQPIDVVGVTPPEFYGLAVGEQFDIAIPLCRPPQLFREVFDVAVVGRLRPDWTLERASAHLDALSAGIFAANAPSDYGASSLDRFKAFRLAAYPIASGVSALRSRYEQSLQVLIVITALILLTACANLANLMLARASARDREVAVRVALGASRSALIRQFLTESLLLATGGALVAVVLARFFSLTILWAMSSQGDRPELTVPLDWRTLLFAAGVGLATCIFFGVVPALRATRVDAMAAMKSAGRGTTAGHERLIFQRVMVASQIAMSLVMLVAALVFVASFRNLMTFDPGMRQEGITSAFFRFEPSQLAPERYKDFQREVLAEVQSVPGVLSAGSTTHVPLIGGSWSHGITVGAIKNSAQFTWASPGYFETMGIRILQGRDFTLQDTSASPRVAVVNEAFVRRFIGSKTPLGEVLRTGAEPNYPETLYQIVGVIPDTQYNDLRGEVRPIVFAPDSQFPAPGPGMQVMLHSRVSPTVVIENIRQRMRQKYPDTSVEFSVLQTQVRDGLIRERLLAMLAGFFGILAIALTVVGLYGMLSYSVAQRRPEIGVRLALGARSEQVVGMMMRETATLLVAGSLAGLLISVFAGRMAASLLFGVRVSDPLILAGACALLAAIAAAASFLPARRASRINPAQVLTGS